MRVITHERETFRQGLLEFFRCVIGDEGGEGDVADIGIFVEMGVHGFNGYFFPGDVDGFEVGSVSQGQLHRCTGFTADTVGSLFGGHARGIVGVDGGYLIAGCDAVSLCRSAFDDAVDYKLLLIFALHQVDAYADDASIDGIIFVLEGSGV